MSQSEITYAQLIRELQRTDPVGDARVAKRARTRVEWFTLLLAHAKQESSESTCAACHATREEATLITSPCGCGCNGTIVLCTDVDACTVRCAL